MFHNYSSHEAIGNCNLTLAYSGMKCTVFVREMVKCKNYKFQTFQTLHVFGGEEQGSLFLH